MKHEALEEDKIETDLVSFNSRNRVMAEDDAEQILYEIHSVKEEPGIIKQITENRPFYYVNVDVKIEHEALEENNLETDLVNLNSRNKIIYEEDTENLYEDHTIKEELVLGPEIVQKNNNTMLLQKFVHSASDENRKKLQCGCCSKIFSCKADFIKHNMYRCINLFICDHCNEKFDSRVQILCHIKKSHTEVFSNSNDLNIKKTNQHSMKEHRNNDQICEVCDKKFCFNKSLMQHMRSHNSYVRNANKICDICGKKFAGAPSLERHINIVHKGKKPYNCNECDKSYRDKSHFQYHHLKTHSSSSIITAKQNMPALTFCQYCNEVFVGKSRCSFHETYRCTKNKNTQEKIKIKKEPCTRVCVNAKPTCDICKKKYCNRSSLNQHMKTHLGTRQVYQCDVCGKSYTKKANLKGHIQSKHMNLRVYSCDKCKNTYTSLWAVTCHKRKRCPRTHECNTCHRHFKNIPGLKRHIKKYHKYNLHII